MVQARVLFPSEDALTDTLRTLSIAAPVFLILIGCYILYENLLPDLWLRSIVLVSLLIAVAVVAPFGGRLKHVEITEQSFRVLPSNTVPYEIQFADVEGFSIEPLLGVVKLKLGSSESLPTDSVWFIPKVTQGRTRHQQLEEIRSFLKQHLIDSHG